MNHLVITIHPSPSDEGLLRVSDAMQQVIDALRVLEQAERALVSPQESFEWRLERASAGSALTVVAVAKPINPIVDVTPHVTRVKAEGSRGMRDFISRGVPPPADIPIPSLDSRIRRSSQKWLKDFRENDSTAPAASVKRGSACPATIPPISVTAISAAAARARKVGTSSGFMAQMIS